MRARPLPFQSLCGFVEGDFIAPADFGTVLGSDLRNAEALCFLWAEYKSNLVPAAMCVRFRNGHPQSFATATVRERRNNNRASAYEQRDQSRKTIVMHETTHPQGGQSVAAI